MFYAIMSEDVPNSKPVRQTASAEHRAYLQSLRDAGRLLLAGPHPAIDCNEPGDAGYSGSLIIAQFNSLEDAQAWAAADPFTAAGVYQKTTIKPFKKFMP